MLKMEVTRGIQGLTEPCGAGLTPGESARLPLSELRMSWAAVALPAESVVAGVAAVRLLAELVSVAPGRCNTPGFSWLGALLAGLIFTWPTAGAAAPPVAAAVLAYTAE